MDADEADALRIDAAAAEAEAAMARDKAEELREELDEVKELAASLAASNENLRTQLKNAHSERDGHAGTISRLQRLLNEVESQRDRAKVNAEQELVPEINAMHERLLEAQRAQEDAESRYSSQTLVSDSLRKQLEEARGVAMRVQRDESQIQSELAAMEALKDGLRDELAGFQDGFARMASDVAEARSERDHWRRQLRQCEQHDEGLRRDLETVDDVLLAIADGGLILTSSLQALPPWRAVLLARVGIHAGAALQNGTYDQLSAAARKVGGDGVLGDWWR